MRPRLVTLAIAAAVLSALAAGAAPDPEALRQAKALFFDRQYAEARAAWQGIEEAGGSKDATYWIARCSESLGESEITTDTIGENVMQHLRDLDHVAYVRFASVYKNFREPKDFETAVAELSEDDHKAAQAPRK